MVIKTSSIKMMLFLSTTLLLALLTGCNSASQPEITGVTWRWISLSETEPAAQSLVPNPENYTIMFNADGSLSLKLDCNSGGGKYQRTDEGMTIEMGMTTLAFCGEDSLDMQFINLLSQVDSYTLENGDLVLSYDAGAGRMTFSQ